MAYRNETIKAMMIQAFNLKKHYESMKASDIKLAMSNGNRKIGKVMNVSMMPIMTCGNCKECMGYCYDIKACIQYKNVIDARIRNTVLAINHREKYFAEIEKRISRRRTNKYFRWHVSGDILDINYFSEMVEIARRHPDFVFWTYTKMYSIVNDYCDLFSVYSIPENLHIMFSKWDGLEMNNPYNFPIFACKMKDGNKDKMEWDKMFKCVGNCDYCKAHCTGCIKGENTFADEH